jgi:AhpD family alkylhydroperoxidase
LSSSPFTDIFVPILKFNRRTYRSPGEFAADLAAILRKRKGLRTLMRGDRLDPAFRERLMLAVTAVNQCRYCSYAHARMALVAGLSTEEIQALNDGILEGAPPDQYPALLYAQHWAEADGKPDPQARQRLLSTFGEGTAGAIELSLLLIRIGNLLGNTFDYILYCLSFGRWDTRATTGVEPTRDSDGSTVEPLSPAR